MKKVGKIAVSVRALVTVDPWIGSIKRSGRPTTVDLWTVQWDANKTKVQYLACLTIAKETVP